MANTCAASAAACARTWISTVSGDVIAAIGLLDLAGLPRYPPSVLTADDRRVWIKSLVEDEVADARFRQHVAVHELEAWVLSDPEAFPVDVGDELRTIAARPEAVNFDNKPAQRIDAAFRKRLNRRYRKTTDGGDLLARANVSLAYEKCPSLRALLDDMRDLALAAARSGGS